MRMRALRRACAAAVVLLAPACAHIEAPSGGPVDSIAPMLIATRPDSNAVMTGWRGPAVFVYSEGLSEEGVEQAVTLSPRRGPVAVDKEGDEIRVQPRRGWEPGIIYQIEVAPGLKDRFNNVIRTRSRLVFSTGPALPDTRATGTVVDRITGEPSVDARVDARRLPDSLVYSTLTDSAGRFTFAQVPEGEYRVLAYRDANRNFRVDAFEQRDTVMLAIVAGQVPTAEFALLPNDTTAPVVGSARMTSGWVEVRFDDYLDPDQVLTPEQVTLTGPDGVAVAIAEVRVGPPPAATRDTAEAEGDSLAPPALQPARPGAAPRPGITVPPPVGDTARADTTPPRGPLPSQGLFAKPATELLPNTLYTVVVRDVRNVNGLVGGGEAPLRTPPPPPPPPPPADTTARDSAAADSAAVERVPPAVRPAVPDEEPPAVVPSAPADSTPPVEPTSPPVVRPPGRGADARTSGAPGTPEVRADAYAASRVAGRSVARNVQRMSDS